MLYVMHLYVLNNLTKLLTDDLSCRPINSVKLTNMLFDRSELESVGAA